MQIALLTLNLTERFDAVCFDTLYQYRTLSAQVGEGNVRLFAGVADPNVHVGVNVGNAEAFRQWCADNPNGVVIFHYCDGGNIFDKDLRSLSQRVIIRWHNNTPPWFNIESSGQAIHAQIGYENIVRYIESGNVRFWVNSSFTGDQLAALGCARSRIEIIYPGSRFLDEGVDVPHVRNDQRGKYGFDILFVGRIVPHKGHLNAILTATALQRMTSLPVRMHFVGKRDPGMTRFNMELDLANDSCPAEIIFHGQVSPEKLASLYNDSDAFLCLSEHEGFGLPVFEAVRSGLPVVLWATTAFRELFRDHPFAFQNFDPVLFAAALLSLKDFDSREFAKSAQSKLSHSYSHEVIERQTRASVSKLYFVTEPTPVDFDCNPSLRFPEIGGVFGSILTSLSKASFATDEPVRHDSGSNLVSLYDLEQYRRFFERKRDSRFAPIAADGARSVKIEPIEQSFANGTLSEGKITWAAKSLTGCILWGPYIELAPGEYVASFHMRATWVGPTPKLKVDVSRTEGLVVERMISASELRSGEVVEVRFKVEALRDWYEFRLSATSEFNGALVFTGVHLRNVEVKGQQQKRSVPKEIAWLPSRDTSKSIANPGLVFKGVCLGPVGKQVIYDEKIDLPQGEYQLDLQIAANSEGGGVEVSISSGLICLANTVRTSETLRDYEPLIISFCIDHPTVVRLSIQATGSATELYYAGSYLSESPTVEKSGLLIGILPTVLLRRFARRAMRLKRFEMAVKYFDILEVRKQIDNKDWVQYGHALKEEQHLNRAEVAYHRALSTSHQDNETKLHLSHLYIKMNRRAKAWHFFSQLLDTPYSQEASSILTDLRAELK